jgi:peptidoglycan/LPS O-acetylase OafA/YrhL
MVIIDTVNIAINQHVKQYVVMHNQQAFDPPVIYAVPSFFVFSAFIITYRTLCNDL